MSSINPNNINGQYPIAGQDNDSQGFRDNFTNIKNNFTYAYNEINDLQQNAVLKGALNGGTVSNDMNYTQLIHAQLLGTVETGNPLGTKTGSFTINWGDGHFQYFTTGDNVTLAFTGWPNNLYFAKLRLQITTDQANRTLTFPSSVSVGISQIQGAVGQVVTLPTADTYVFELTTYDNGGTITIVDLLRNYDVELQGASAQFDTIIANASTVSTTYNTGALTVPNGGLGVGGNVNVGSSLRVVGSITKKVSDEHTAVTTARTIDFSTGGDELVYVNMTANIGVAYSSTIVAGRQPQLAIKNTSGTLYYVNLPNANSNKNAGGYGGNIAIPNNTYATLVFTAFDTTSGNVIVRATTN